MASLFRCLEAVGREGARDGGGGRRGGGGGSY